MQDELPTQVLPLIKERCSMVRGTSCSARRNCRMELAIALLVCGTLTLITFVCLATQALIFL